MKNSTRLLTNKRQLLFGFIVVLAIALRLFKLGSVPIELNRDEASLGYTANLLLTTGKDEHGNSWPIQIESFGDWKLPLYVYILIPVIKLFGLAAWTVRLPSALAGVSIVISSFYLVSLLTDRKTRPWLQFLVMLSLTISPWAVHFSHVAYEAHLSLALFLWGLVALLTTLRDFAAGHRRLDLLVVSQVLWAITLVGYHAYQVFIPLFWLWTAYLYRQQWRQFFSGNKTWLLIALVPFMLAIGLLLGSGGQAVNQTKFGGLSIFDLNSYNTQVTDRRKMVPDSNHPIFVLVVNKFGAVLTQLETNLLRLISPEFLFLRGGDNHAHNITGYGNFYPIMIIGLVIGLVSSVIRPENWQLLLIGWLVAASVAPLLTFQANHSVRFSPAFVAIEVLSAYGFIKLFQILHKYTAKKFLITFMTLIVMGLSYNIFQFLVHYNYVFPQQDARYWSWQMKRLVYWLGDNQANYDAIYFEDETYSPYIYFLFYESPSSAALAQRVDYYPVDPEGFRHVRRLDKLYFQQINWNDLQLYEGKNVLFVVEEQQIPDFNRFNENYTLLTTLRHDWVPRGIEIWEYRGKP